MKGYLFHCFFTSSINYWLYFTALQQVQSITDHINKLMHHCLIGSKDGSIRTLVLWVTICRSTIWAPILLLVTMVKCIIENYQSSQNTRFRSSDPQRDLDANLLFFRLEYIDGSRAVYSVQFNDLFILQIFVHDIHFKFEFVILMNYYTLVIIILGTQCLRLF